MKNKYLYALAKDKQLRTFFMFSAIGTVFCVILIQWDVRQALVLKGIHDKQVLILQIPMMQSEITEKKQSFNGLVLNGIVSSDDQPRAVINNKFFGVGGIVEGKKVVKITGHRVTVCDVISNRCFDLTF